MLQEIYDIQNNKNLSVQEKRNLNQLQQKGKFAGQVISKKLTCQLEHGSSSHEIHISLESSKPCAQGEVFLTKQIKQEDIEKIQ